MLKNTYTAAVRTVTVLLCAALCVNSYAETGGSRKKSSYAKTERSGAVAVSYTDDQEDDVYEPESEDETDDIAPAKNVPPSKKQPPKKAAPKKSRTASSPRPKKYIIKKGDTIYSVAKRFGIPVEKLCETNCLTRTSGLVAGNKLYIPSKTGTDAGQSTKAPSYEFIWPVKQVQSVRQDGENGVHTIGVVIKAKSGSKVCAAAKGTVKKVGYMHGFGNYVVIAHSERYLTVYSNLYSVAVQEGDSVLSGAMVGTVSGDNTLHFQINCAGKPKNPLALLPKRS